MKLHELKAILGIGESAVWMLRKEAGDRPVRCGRRAHSYSDYPGVDWTTSASDIGEVTGLSRRSVYKLREEWELATLGHVQSRKPDRLFYGSPERTTRCDDVPQPSAVEMKSLLSKLETALRRNIR